jgi:putative salt-induced outer membrane protein YdiY
MKRIGIVLSTVVAVWVVAGEAAAQSAGGAPLVKADQQVLCPKGCVTEIENPHDWDVSAAFGLNATSGNADSSVYSINAVAQREIMKNLFRFEVTGARGEQENLESGEKEVAQEFVRGDLTYKYLLGEEQRAYAGLGATALYDRIAEVDYRAVINPALGYFFLKEESVRLSGEAGPSYVFEEVGDVEDDYLAPRVAERFEWDITTSSKLFQAVEFLFDINDSENTIINSEAGLEASIATNLALVFSVRSRFDNEPADGRERNDMFYTSAIKVRL